MKKELKVVVAIAYDFDGTLAAGNMQEYDFIPGLDTVVTRYLATSSNI